MRQALAGNALHRPHWGSIQHGDSTGSQWYSGVYPSFRAPRWPGCHKTTYYLLDASLPTSWRAEVRAAFAAWDQPQLCSPHWVETTSSTSASVRVRRSATSGCDPTNDPARVWFACAQRDAVNTTTLSQKWVITYNADHPFRIATSGYHDVRSIAAVELAHVHHGGHNPNWTDSISQANAARWGNVVTHAGWTGGEVQSQSYTVCPSDSSLSCTYHVCARIASGGCGNQRRLLTGDLALLNHIYGANARACTTAGATRTACTGCCGAGDAGTLVQTCTAHSWSTGTCLVTYVDAGTPAPVDAGVRSDAGAGDGGVRPDAGAGDGGVFVDAGLLEADAGAGEDAGLPEEELPLDPDPVDLDAGGGYDGVDTDPQMGMDPNPLEPADSPDPNEVAPELDPDDVTPITSETCGCGSTPGALGALMLLALLTARRRASRP